MATSSIQTPVCPPEVTLDCPWRQPDWRWQRAIWRAQSRSRRSERQDDDWTHRAMGCVKAIHREACGYRPYRPDPDVMHARQLAQHHDWNRAELEARILSDQPIDQISSTMGVSTGVISAFEGIFFDVRPRLGCQSWIVYDVIGLKPSGPLQPQDVTKAWRYFGFMYGPCTLDVLLAGADRADLQRFGLPAYWSQHSRLPKEAQFALVVHSLPQDGIRALRSLNRFVGLGLCETPPRVVPPPEGLALDLTSGAGLDLASWDEQPDMCDTAAEVWEAQAA